MIIETKAGHWVVEGDFNIGKWVSDGGSLDIGHCPRDLVLKYTEPGTIAIDCGANIGTYTDALLNGVGDNGIVFAFEPGEEMFRCVQHNCPRAICINKAISDKHGRGFFRQLEQTPGSSFVHTTLEAGNTYAERFPSHLKPIQFMPLDALGLWASNLKVSLLKIDVEGCEVLCIEGGIATIAKHRPVLMLESNEEALRIQGNTQQDLSNILSELNYEVKFTKEGTGWHTPLSDLICFPR